MLQQSNLVYLLSQFFQTILKIASDYETVKEAESSLAKNWTTLNGGADLRRSGPSPKYTFLVMSNITKMILATYPDLT
jgi:hypothetical protein